MADDQTRHKWEPDKNHPGMSQCSACMVRDDTFTDYGKVAADCPVPLRKEHMLMAAARDQALIDRDEAIAARSAAEAALAESKADLVIAIGERDAEMIEADKARDKAGAETARLLAASAARVDLACTALLANPENMNGSTIRATLDKAAEDIRALE